MGRSDAGRPPPPVGRYGTLISTSSEWEGGGRYVVRFFSFGFFVFGASSLTARRNRPSWREHPPVRTYSQKRQGAPNSVGGFPARA